MKSVVFQSWRSICKPSWRLFPSTDKKPTFSLTGKQGKPVRVLRICACLLGIPKPFFTLRVATRFCKTLNHFPGNILKIKKTGARSRQNRLLTPNIQPAFSCFPSGSNSSFSLLRHFRNIIFFVFHLSQTLVLCGVQALSTQDFLQKDTQSVSSLFSNPLL